MQYPRLRDLREDKDLYQRYSKIIKYEPTSLF